MGLTIRDDDGKQALSIKLNRKSKKQQFRVELLARVGTTAEGSTRCRSSGWQFGPVAGTMVLCTMDLVPLGAYEGADYMARMHDAVLSVEKKEVQELLEKGWRQIDVNAEHMPCVLTAEGDVSRLQGWSRHMRCYLCKTSWYDHKKGGIVKCTTCVRAFHQDCADPRIKSDVDFSTWRCSMCTSPDPIVCEKCHEPFNEKEVEDPTSMENDELVRCSSCEKWWHQACAVPAIYPLPPDDWYCSTCTANGTGKQAQLMAKDSEAEDGKPTETSRQPRKKPRPNAKAAAVPATQSQRPRRASADYGEGKPEGDGWSTKQIYGKDLSSTRTDRVTWDRQR